MTQERILYFITSSAYANIYQDEVPWVEELTKRGVRVIPRVWNSEEDYVYEQHSLALIRTTWGYHLDCDRFLEWIRKTSTKVTVLNDLEAIQQNVHKGYLKILQNAGVPIVPTEFISKGEPTDVIFELIEKRDWKEAIFKPAIGASAHGVCKLSMDKEISKETLELCKSVLQKTDALVQSFQASVCTKGELSLMFFDHIYSHTILKIPPSGKYTLQGGTRHSYEPSDKCKDIASRAIQALAGSKKLLYGRVDLLFGDEEDSYLVSEVELIEPLLFFLHSSYAVQLFVDSICARFDDIK